MQIDVRRRVVDATYLSPTIPATTPPPFGVADDVRVVAINELARLDAAPNRYVIVGSGKTATDGIVWLLANGVPPDRIVWVRPRDPWMLNRAVVQPDPVVALGLAADTMAAAADAESLDDLFLRLEAAGVMLRIDTGRRAHDGQDADPRRMGARSAPHDRARRSSGTRRARDPNARSSSTTEWFHCAPGSLVVHCAASGLQYPPLVPVWGPDKIRLQTIRVGFPCFCAALAGYVEATRDDDRERNRVCPPNILPDSPADWAQMQVRGTIAARTLRRRARHRGLGESSAPSTPRASSRRNATIPGCRPRPHVWLTSPSAGSRVWVNSRGIRGRASTGNGNCSAALRRVVHRQPVASGAERQRQLARRRFDALDAGRLGGDRVGAVPHVCEAPRGEPHDGCDVGRHGEIE